MSGNQNSGRRKKPIAQHVHDGTFRPDRHNDPLLLIGTPKKPTDLKPEASRIWDLLIAELPEDLLGRLDAVELEQYCLLCQANRDYLQQLEAEPLNDKLRRIQLATLDRMMKLGDRFGMNPSARENFKLQPKDDPDNNPLLKYLNRAATT